MLVSSDVDAINGLSFQMGINLSASETLCKSSSTSFGNVVEGILERVVFKKKFGPDTGGETGVFAEHLAC